MAKVRRWWLSRFGWSFLRSGLGLCPRCCCWPLLLLACLWYEVCWWRLGRSMMRLGLGLLPRCCCWLRLLLAGFLSEVCWWRFGLWRSGLLRVPRGLRLALHGRLVMLGGGLLHRWVGGLCPGVGLGMWRLESCRRQAPGRLRGGFGAAVG